MQENLRRKRQREALGPLGIMRSKKPKKRPEVAVKPKPSPRLTIFDEEVDPDEGLFGPSTKLSAQHPAEDVPLKDHRSPTVMGGSACRPGRGHGRNLPSWWGFIRSRLASLEAWHHLDT